MGKATVEREALKHALGVLAKCAYQKATLPAIQNVRFTANGHVQIEATDLEVSAVFKLARQGKGGEFQALLPAQRLAEYVRKAKGDTVTFERQDEFRTGLDGVAAMVGLSPLEDFPQTLGEDGKLLARVAAGELATALRVVKFAASSEVVRYALTGVLFEVRRTGTGNGPKSYKGAFVASDGKRLSAANVSVDSVDKAAQCRIIIPWKAAELLERMAAGVDPLDWVEVRGVPVQATDAATGKKSETADMIQAHFRVGVADLFSRLVQGHFPDWQAVVPANVDQVATFDRKQAIVEIERVRQACTDKTLATRFTFGPGKLTLFSKTQDVGEARADIPWEGNAQGSIVFNPDYVLDFLKALPKGSERVTLRFRDKACAGVFTGGIEGHSYVLMPLTINI